MQDDPWYAMMAREEGMETPSKWIYLGTYVLGKRGMERMPNQKHDDASPVLTTR
jgi:hypothetical protein